MAGASNAGNRRRRSRAPAGGATGAGNDDAEEHHLNPFLDAAPSTSSRIQFRDVASRARWVEEAGAAEVVEGKGKLWLTTGVTRGGKLCYNVEEIGFLVERGAMILLSDKDETIGIEGIYEKIAGGKYGCSWDAFQAYKHLKSLGYIVGRYGVPWTLKNSGTCDTTVPPTSVVHTDQSFNKVDGTCSDRTKSLKEMHIDRLSPSFEVNKPFLRVELERLENNFGGIPLKYCHVDHGRVSFLSFDEVALPSLP
nr:unnamed protein product [Digitaria exilis]